MIVIFCNFKGAYFFFNPRNYQSIHPKEFIFNFLFFSLLDPWGYIHDAISFRSM